MRLFSIRFVCGTVATIALLPGQALGDISFLDMFRNDAYEQTGDGNSLSSVGSFFTLGLAAQNPGDFSSVSATTPGPISPVTLTSTDPTDFAYQTGLYATQADMDADFPFGTYSYSALGGGGTSNASFDYTADAYALTLPYLANNSYSALQGMHPHADLHVDFSPFSVNPATTVAFVFFSLRDNVTSSIVFDGGFMPPTTTGITIPANTLLNGRTYTFELIYSDRVLLSSPGAQFDAQIGFDLRTDGQFTTVPEPGTLTLAAIGLAALAFTVRRRLAGC